MQITSPGNRSRKQRYVIIIPARNEELFLPEVIKSLAAQTIRPYLCIIVNDGSTDKTGRIADEAAVAHSWIRVVHRPDRGTRSVGPGVIEAFYSGFQMLRTVEYDYICKLDADITLGEKYFEALIARMEADPKLGAASGKVFNPNLSRGKIVEEKIIDEMVSGAAKFYKRQTFQDIGGFVKEIMWDGIDFHHARMCGWKTRSFDDEALRIYHHRLMGSSQKNIIHGRLRWGRGQWFMGTHPLYILASGVYRMMERPFLFGGLLIIAGYFWAMVKGAPRYEDLSFRKCLHEWQLKRLRLGWLVKRSE